MVPDVYNAIFGEKRMMLCSLVALKEVVYESILLNLKHTITAYLHSYIFRKFEINYTLIIHFNIKNHTVSSKW